LEVMSDLLSAIHGLQEPLRQRGLPALSATPNVGILREGERVSQLAGSDQARRRRSAGARPLTDWCAWRGEPPPLPFPVREMDASRSRFETAAEVGAPAQHL